MEAKLISLVNLWRDDRQDRYLDSFYSHIKDYDDSKVSSVLKAVRRFFGAEEESFVHFVTTLSARNDGAFDEQVEGTFGLTPVGHGVTPTVDSSPTFEQKKKRQSVFINERGLAYAKKSGDFDASTARELAEKLMLEGYESIVLVLPSHLTKDEAEVFVGLVEDSLVEQGFPREEIHRSEKAFAKAEDLVAHVERLGNRPDKTKRVEGEKRDSNQSEGRGVKREDLTATGEKVYDALNDLEHAKLSEVLSLLDDAGVSLSLIDSGEGKKFLSFYDRELSMSLSGSKMCPDKSAFQFNGSYLSEKVDFNFDLNEFFVEVVNLSADKLASEGVAVGCYTINEKLKEMGYSFKLSNDGKTIENCFFRKVDGKKFNLVQGFKFDDVSPPKMGGHRRRDYGGMPPQDDMPPMDYGDMPSQNDMPPMDYGGMPSQYDMPPMDYGDIPSQNDMPPMDYGDMPPQNDMPPMDYGDMPPQNDMPPMDYGDMPPQYDMPPMDHGDMPPQNEVAREEFDATPSPHVATAESDNAEVGSGDKETKGYSPFEKALVDAVAEEEERMDEIYRDLNLPEADSSSPSLESKVKRHVNPF